jgi:glutamine synthetase
MDLGLEFCSPLSKDAGDRNRTSPFAFTGNRFEFRAVGSNQSVAGPLIVLNTMLADSLEWVAIAWKPNYGKGTELNSAIIMVLKEVMELHGRDLWRQRLLRRVAQMAVNERGLENLPTTADALPVLKAEYIKICSKRPVC